MRPQLVSVEGDDFASIAMTKGSQVSEQVRSLYDELGWLELEAGITYDAHTWEDLRPVASDYVTATRRRVLRHLPASGGRLLDMASGPIQYPEYLEYSAGFAKRVCVDLSQRALDMARAKIGDHGDFLCGDFLDRDIPPNSMDAAVSLHTVYHIHSSRQAAVVRKLVHVVKPGANVVIVYSNPDNLVSMLTRPIRKMLGKIKDNPSAETLYFEPQSLKWWQQFADIADVKIYPWRMLSTRVQKRLIPAGHIGKRMLNSLLKLEERFPRSFVRMGCYPMIVLRKR